MKIFANLKWLFTNAPTNITNSTEEMFCDYCGESDGGISNYTVAGLKICSRCQKKAFDKILSDS